MGRSTDDDLRRGAAATPVAGSPRTARTQPGPAWERVCSILRRDWERVRRRQREPSGSKLDELSPYCLSWSEVEPALRFGYGAARRHGYKQPWSSGLDQQLEIEWQRLGSGKPWNQVRFLVYRGWLRAMVAMNRVDSKKEEEH